MSGKIRALIESIIEHQAEIDHDLEMISLEVPGNERMLAAIRLKQQELVREIEGMIGTEPAETVSPDTGT